MHKTLSRVAMASLQIFDIDRGGPIECLDLKIVKWICWAWLDDRLRLVAWAGLGYCSHWPVRHPRVLYTGIQVPNECVFAPIATDRSDRRWFTLTEGSPLNWSRLILQHFEAYLVVKKCLTPNPEVSEHVKVPRACTETQKKDISGYVCTFLLCHFVSANGCKTATT
jgi:hypothetical protein